MEETEEQDSTQLEMWLEKLRNMTQEDVVELRRQMSQLMVTFCGNVLAQMSLPELPKPQF
jgi:hypothetical protein